jgi:hypothetical protein
LHRWHPGHSVGLPDILLEPTSSGTCPSSRPVLPPCPIPLALPDALPGYHPDLQSLKDCRFVLWIFSIPFQRYITCPQILKISAVKPTKQICSLLVTADQGGPITVVQTPRGRYKGKKLRSQEAWLGLAWFGLAWLTWTLHNILGELPSCVFASGQKFMPFLVLPPVAGTPPPLLDMVE